jgi:hypothetical protein
MGRIHTIGNIRLWVYANDHLPPHFHVLSPDAEAIVEIATFEVLAGALPRGANADEAMEWARQNRDQIIAEWNRVNPRFPTNL